MCSLDYPGTPRAYKALGRLDGNAAMSWKGAPALGEVEPAPGSAGQEAPQRWSWPRKAGLVSLVRKGEAREGACSAPAPRGTGREGLGRMWARPSAGADDGRSRSTAACSDLGGVELEPFRVRWRTLTLYASWPFLIS